MHEIQLAIHRPTIIQEFIWRGVDCLIIRTPYSRMFDQKSLGTKIVGVWSIHLYPVGHVILKPGVHSSQTQQRKLLTGTSTDEEELIRLLGFAPLERIAEFTCSRSEMDLHYPTQELKTPLTTAIDRGDVSILKTLLDAYPVVLMDSTTTQPFGKTALMHASYVTRNSDVLRVLVERGADVHKIDTRGWNCLYYAIVGERKENIKFCLESGANLNSKDFDGRTPLMIAVILSTLEIAKYLLNQGADARATDDLGFSALRLAILRKKQELAVLLVKSGSVLSCTPPIFTHSDYELAKYLMPDLRPVIGTAKRKCSRLVAEELLQTMVGNE